MWVLENDTDVALVTQWQNLSLIFKRDNENLFTKKGRERTLGVALRSIPSELRVRMFVLL